MTLQQLLDADAAAKAQHGKRAGEIACKYPQSSVDLSTHTPAEDWEALADFGVPSWRLTQTGADKVWEEYKQNGGSTPPPSTPLKYTYDGVNQYHHTGALMESNAKGSIFMTFKLLSQPSANEYLCGFQIGGGGWCAMFITGTRNMRCAIGTALPTDLSVQVQIGVQYDVQLIWDNGTVTGLLDFTPFTDTTYSGLPAGLQEFPIGCMYAGSGATSPSNFANIEVSAFQLYGATSNLTFDVHTDGWGTAFNNPTPG